MGWQIFNLREKIQGAVNASRFCIKIHVLAKEEGNSTYILLNRTQIQSLFVLDASRPHELDKQPVIVQYIHQPAISLPSGVSPFYPSPGPFPFFKRSLPETPAPQDRDPSYECSVEERIISLVDFFPNIIMPTTVDVGQCITNQPTVLEIENLGKESPDEEFPSGTLCQPTARGRCQRRC